ncbi:hypothetical protein EV121DRAFT_277725 [Schizophyllum commune]
MRTFAHRKGQSWTTLAVIIALFVSSTIVVATDIAFWTVQIPSTVRPARHRPPTELLFRFNVVLVATRRCIYLLSDAIVVWRAWVLWPNSRVAKAILSTCMCGSAVGAILNAVWTIQNDRSVKTLPRIQSLALTVPLLLTNVVATSLVGLQVWYYRRDIKGSLGLYTRKSQVETVLVLLVESGCLYSLLWAVYLAFLLTAGTGGSTVTNYVGTAIHSISGIHPTIVVLVVMHAATAESLIDTAQVSHALHFVDTRESRSVRLGDASTGLGDESMASVILARETVGGREAPSVERQSARASASLGRIDQEHEVSMMTHISHSRRYLCD